MELNKAVDKTLRYAKKYGASLTWDEIKERLISNKIWKDEEINRFLESIKKTNLKNEEIIRIKNDKEKKVKELANLIDKNFKDILMLGITGSVAAGYPKKNDDIDLIIVTKKYKLWWTRLKLRWFIYSKKIPHRKYGEKEKTDEFCFNLWLDESSLEIPKNRQNLRSAVDLILMKPIINKNNIYTKFGLENDWAKKYVATEYSKKLNPLSLRDISLKKGNCYENNSIITMVWYVLNLIFFLPQYVFMKKKIKNGTVKLKQAFFHPKDSGKY